MLEVNKSANSCFVSKSKEIVPSMATSVLEAVYLYLKSVIQVTQPPST